MQKVRGKGLPLSLKRIVLVVTVFLIFGCQNVQKPHGVVKPAVTADAAKLISEKIIKLSPVIPFQTVIVLWFTDRNGSGLAYGRMLADRIQSYLLQVPTLKIADYPLSKRTSKWSSPEEIVRAGQSLNADVVLEGDMLQMKEYNDINARLFDARTGKLIEEIRVRESIEDFRLNDGPDQEK